MQFDLTKSVIVGQGITSIHTAEYLIKKGCAFSIYSLKSNRLPQHLSKYYVNDPLDYSMAWLSPGIQANDPIMNFIDKDKTWLDIDYFLYNTTKPVILVTGTNGKSTVSCMIRDMLKQLGYMAVCYGNYQPGLLSVLDQDVDWVIIELSSYQLSHMKYTGKVSATLLLNITVNHINWHGSFESYQASKLKIHNFSDLNIGVNGRYGFRQRIKPLIKLGYNFQDAYNIAASIEVLVRLGLRPIIGYYPKLPYRQNTIVRKNQVIINDSKSCTLVSTVNAIKLAKMNYPNKPILLILAGIEKGEPSDQIIKEFTSNVTVIIIGKGFQELSGFCAKRYSCIKEAMSSIMNHKGIVLFSPGGASHDQYGNYEERGEDFNRRILNVGES